ncbi:MAG TPA: ATP-binding protein [Myxococcota bacterium]|nr:ATP-binding protein [Myxococcota bacterium]HOD00072.1 ATP-binding protein [Myxococcota bacterium]HOH77148.1 ATP-binding protein [Myxococcota bacterium]
MYCIRTIENNLRKVSEQFRVVLITGPRQVGKTTLLRHLGGPDRRFVTLDDPAVLQIAREDPGLFFQRFPPPITIDEIQYAPGLLTYIKMIVDDDGTPGRFWLTGSQQFPLMKGVSESLAGRIAIINILGLSYAEADGRGSMSLPFIPGGPGFEERIRDAARPDLQDVYARIFRGSMPELVLNPDLDPAVWFGSYVQTYIQRDVRDLARVGDEMAFLRFLRATAARTGTLLNLADLARDADIAPNTAKNWMSILVTSGIVHLLEPWFRNQTKRIVKAPKIYFLDTGLCAYLTGWPSASTLETGAMTGQILETWVVAELLKTFWHNAKRAPLYFMRDRDGREIDILIQNGDTLHPFEVKKSAMPGRDDIRHFQMLDSTGMNVGEGGVFCLAGEFMPLNERNRSIPITAI